MSLGASVASIGLFTSSFMFTSAMLAPKLGGLSDKMGRKRVILWGLLGDVIFGTLTGLVPSWHWLLLIRTLNGAVTAAATLPAEALVIDHTPEDRRGEATGFVTVCGMIGRSLGPAFGVRSSQFASSTRLSLVDSYRVPYFVDAALAALAMMLVAWKIKEGRRVTRPPLGLPAIKKRKSVPIPISRSLKILFLCAFANGIALGFVMPISVLFYRDKFGAEPVLIGFIISLSGFIGLLASWIGGRISDRLGRKPVIGIGGISSRLAGMVLPLSLDLNQATFFLALRSLGFNINMPAMQALRADIVPEEARGRLFGLYRASFTWGISWVL
ncbi:MAG: bicyclomycin/multidrug efflux system [Candidatus Bathyarchaeota archaeon BA1]|nr:MAG: bicyclomycin/multidrug efflux system [Candidatus Bathyarchaeota archaeon BA1]